MLEWLSSNKEWVFSGIGVLAITAIGGILKLVFFGKRKKSAPSEIHQRQRGGMFSNNTQIGNISVNEEE